MTHAVALLELATDLETVYAWQRGVEQDQIRCALAGERQRLLARRGCHHVVAALREETLDASALARVSAGDQHVQGSLCLGRCRRCSLERCHLVCSPHRGRHALSFIRSEPTGRLRCLLRSTRSRRSRRGSRRCLGFAVRVASTPGPPRFANGMLDARFERHHGGHLDLDLAFDPGDEGRVGRVAHRQLETIAVFADRKDAVPLAERERDEIEHRKVGFRLREIDPGKSDLPAEVGHGELLGQDALAHQQAGQPFAAGLLDA